LREWARAASARAGEVAGEFVAASPAPSCALTIEKVATPASSRRARNSSASARGAGWPARTRQELVRASRTTSGVSPVTLSISRATARAPSSPPTAATSTRNIPSPCVCGVGASRRGSTRTRDEATGAGVASCPPISFEARSS
jgi:hypothetical protein